ncbi:MAG TPA: UdgX family uracil-DNA binding protein, partial [Vicinamibacterales bacterium]|nr:UdgX family uracil-DNA binding protein [Vicinamibacterales bacterium]
GVARRSPPSGTAAPLVPPRPTLAALKRAAAGCRACPLWRGATQTVFGEGRRGARVVLVGEQPGDAEDRAGRPFVGPAGRLLDRALAAAGIDRRDVYVTNVVKHFKWEPRGKRRIHKKPSASEIAACRPWLDAELALVRPAVVVCLGATAAQALLGSSYRVSRARGRFVQTRPGAPAVMATVHPSSVLRAPDDRARRAAREAFVADLRLVAARLASAGGGPSGR